MGHAGVRLVALFDNDPTVSSPFEDIPFFQGQAGFQEWQATAGPGPYGFLVAIGGERGRDRMEIQAWLESRGLKPLIARHPTAFVAANAVVGPGSQILAQATVAVETRIGAACIVNTAASVDHESVIEDGVHICPGAHLAGCVHVERYATIGTGAVIIPRIRVGRGATVGAGAVVVHDIEPCTIVAGNPARAIGTRKQTA